MSNYNFFDLSTYALLTYLSKKLYNCWVSLDFERDHNIFYWEYSYLEQVEDDQTKVQAIYRRRRAREIKK
jgi:hypothetical protein